MEFVNVSTQAELDKALKQSDVIPVVVGNGTFVIRSGAPVIHVGESSQPRMEARESSQPRMEAWGSSQPTMVARGSSQPTMVARGSSQPRMVARESSQPRMEARESSQPTMEARGSSQPRMEARESSQVKGKVGKFTLVGVIKHGNAVVDLPGAVILKSREEITDLDEWIDYYALQQARGWVTVFKLVGDDLKSGHGTLYEIGSDVSCPDWDPAPRCGEGLHFSPHPSMARCYAEGTRYVACKIRKKDVVLLGDKLKAPSCKVLFECDEDGEQLVTEAKAA